MAPRLDGRVVSPEEDIGNFPTLVVRGAGVVGMVKQAMCEGILLGGLIVAENAWQQTDNGVGEHQRGRLLREGLEDALVGMGLGGVAGEGGGGDDNAGGAEGDE